MKIKIFCKILNFQIYFPMNKKQFLLYKKLYGRINHHQLLNEFVLHNFFCFLSNIINCQEQLNNVEFINY